jgi:hypothetical protein
MNLMRAYERRLPATFMGAKIATSTGSQSSSTTASSAATLTATCPHFRRLSLDELVAKRANDECYYCPKKFSNDHKCKTKGVFLLELDDDAEAEEVDEDLGISLHTLTHAPQSDQQFRSYGL